MSNAVMLEAGDEFVHAEGDVSNAVMLEAGEPVSLVPTSPVAKAKAKSVAVDEAEGDGLATVDDDPYGEADADAAAAAEDDPERRKAMLRWRLRRMIEAEGLTIREVLYLR